VVDLVGAATEEPASDDEPRSPRKKPLHSKTEVATAGLAGGDGLHFFFVDIEVRVDVLDVVVIFEHFHHADHLAAAWAPVSFT
jgi:hypothetical protein